MRAPSHPALLVAILVAITTAPAGATGKEGRPSEQLVEVASLPLDGDAADVWVHREVAYVGSHGGGCAGAGVRLVDVSRPRSPRLLGSVAGYPNTSAEDVVVRRVVTPALIGDLLATGLQSCGPGGREGLDLWDVTRPRRPVHLGFFPTAVGPHARGVHELDLRQRLRDGRVLAFLAVIGAQRDGDVGDVQIVDVTDPARPHQIFDWSSTRDGGLPAQGGIGVVGAIFAHSMWGSPDGEFACAAHWDAGSVLFDLADLDRVRVLGRTEFPISFPDREPFAEGNAHSCVAFGGLPGHPRYLVQTEEDFNTHTATIEVLGPAPVAGAFRALPGVGTEPLPGPVEAPAVAVGPACPGDELRDELRGAVALVEGGGCDGATKLGQVERAGASGAVLIAERPGGPVRPRAGDEGAGIWAFGIDRSDGQRWLQAGDGLRLRVDPAAVQANPWGYVRFYDVSDPARPAQVAALAIPETFPERATPVDVPPTPAGPLPPIRSVHNPVVAGELGIFSWYDAGVRVFDLADPARPRALATWDTDGPVIWGVVVEGRHLFASDVAGGALHVLELSSQVAGRLAPPGPLLGPPPSLPGWGGRPPHVLGRVTTNWA